MMVMFSEKCFITVWLQSYSERYKNKSIIGKEDIPLKKLKIPFSDFSVNKKSKFYCCEIFTF